MSLVKDLDHLDRYPWTGHSAIMGYQKREWQEIDDVLIRFGEKTGESRKIYRDFIEEGIGIEKRSNLLTGGLSIYRGEWS